MNNLKYVNAPVIYDFVQLNYKILNLYSTYFFFVNLLDYVHFVKHYIIKA